MKIFMALCLIMMFGWLGSVTGGNIVGALLFTQCNVIFYAGVFILLGMYDNDYWFRFDWYFN